MPHRSLSIDPGDGQPPCCAPGNVNCQESPGASVSFILEVCEVAVLCPRSNHEIEQQADGQFSIFQSYQSRLKACPFSTTAVLAAFATATFARTALP
jgi:hypothetical protein